MSRRVGWALRELQRLAREDSPARAAERLRRRAIAEQVAAEVAARFPTITAENAQECLDYQAARIAELEKAKPE